VNVSRSSLAIATEGNVKGVTDEQVRLAQRGDRGAFEELLAPRVDRLYATATLILHDRTLAEDATQEAMVRAWTSLPKLRARDRFDAWLRRVLVHACLDAARSVRHQRAEDELPVNLAGGGDPARIVADRDEVERAFAQLTPMHRAVFVLRHYLGHSVAEVADSLGIPLGTAKSRIHYAERAMADAMDRDRLRALEGGVA
jgi:RNA polymerase sigma-70 factor (ECF subfamily)